MKTREQLRAEMQEDIDRINAVAHARGHPGLKPMSDDDWEKCLDTQEQIQRSRQRAMEQWS